METWSRTFIPMISSAIMRAILLSTNCCCVLLFFIMLSISCLNHLTQNNRSTEVINMYTAVMTDTTPKFSMLSATVIICSTSILFGIAIVVKKRAAYAHPQEGCAKPIDKSRRLLPALKKSLFFNYHFYNRITMRVKLYICNI